MRLPERTRAELREAGATLLWLAEIVGYLAILGAMVRYVFELDPVNATLATVVFLVVIVQRLRRWLADREDKA